MLDSSRSPMPNTTNVRSKQYTQTYTQTFTKDVLIIGECDSNTCLFIDKRDWPVDSPINYELLLRLSISLHTFSKSFASAGNPPSFNKLVLSKKTASTRRGKTTEVLRDMTSVLIDHYIITLITSHTSVCMCSLSTLTL